VTLTKSDSPELFKMQNDLQGTQPFILPTPTPTAPLDQIQCITQAAIGAAIKFGAPPDLQAAIASSIQAAAQATGHAAAEIFDPTRPAGRKKYRTGKEFTIAENMRDELDVLPLSITRPVVDEIIVSGNSPPKALYLSFALRVRDHLGDTWPPQKFHRQVTRSMAAPCSYIARHKNEFRRLYESNAFADLGYPAAREEQAEIAINSPREPESGSQTFFAGLFSPLGDAESRDNSFEGLFDQFEVPFSGLPA
jgi:hypothetical protein